MKKIILQRALAVLALAIFCAATLYSVAAQQGSTTRYVYDDNGRLRAVIAPTGEATIYEYDAAGNFTAIRRATADVLEIFSFSPREGMSGDLVTFIGIGFAGGINAVSFNGVNGRVLEATASSVVAEVPEGATTGPVTITTPGASATTSQPFVLRGVRVRPLSSRLLFGESLQFTVRVETAAQDRSVAWSVNNVVGGNAAVGTISSNGLYTAPNREAIVIVRATSNADAELYGEAQVTLRDPNNLNALFNSLSVRYGLGNADTSVAAAVSVRYGAGNAETALSTPVSVRYGIGTSGAPISRGLSVQYGLSNGSATAISPVSVRYGTESGIDTAMSRGVSAINGPYVSMISPGNLVRGTSTTININGSNLGGVTSLTFIDANGAINSGITVSSLVPNAEGTTLTATVTVNSAAVLGKRVVVAATPDVGSLTTDIGSNRLQIVAP